MAEPIVLGLTDSIDYEVAWDSRILEELILRFAIRDAELSPEVEIRDERDLVVSILGFLKAGIGGERFVETGEAIASFSARCEKRVTLGGTAVRAAIAMRRLGIRSALHLITINEEVRRLLPPDCPYLCSAKEEALYPHLIIQYCEGDRVRAGDIDLAAVRENRLIYTYDCDCMQVELHPGLPELLRTARVFLISGFNAMRDETLLRQRLQTLREMMRSLPPGAQVFLEDGGYHRLALSQVARDMLCDRLNLFSLNEDEWQSYLGRRIDLLDVGQVAQGLLEMHALTPVPMLVLHTRYWVLAYGKNARAYAPAVKGGINMAGTRYRFGDDFTVEEYRDTEQHKLHAGAEAFASAIEERLGERICCRACIDAKVAKPTTIGLGDAFVGGFLPELSVLLARREGAHRVLFTRRSGKTRGRR